MRKPEEEFRKDMDAHVVNDWAQRLKHRGDMDASALPADIPDFACPLFPMNAWGVVVRKGRQICCKF